MESRTTRTSRLNTFARPRRMPAGPSDDSATAKFLRGFFSVLFVSVCCPVTTRAGARRCCGTCSASACRVTPWPRLVPSRRGPRASPPPPRATAERRPHPLPRDRGRLWALRTRTTHRPVRAPDSPPGAPRAPPRAPPPPATARAAAGTAPRYSDPSPRRRRRRPGMRTTER